jgi:plasmid stabilization system protein ParE
MGDYIAAVANYRIDKEGAIKLLTQAQENIESILEYFDVKENPSAVKQYEELLEKINDYAKRLSG